MSNIVPLHQPMRPDVFEAQVHDRSKFPYLVGLTDHARERMAERDITFRQVLNALRKGQIADGPTWDGPHSSWKGGMVYHGGGSVIFDVVALAESELTVDVVTVRHGR